jgi:hypothetical protein
VLLTWCTVKLWAIVFWHNSRSSSFSKRFSPVARSISPAVTVPAPSTPARGNKDWSVAPILLETPGVRDIIVTIQTFLAKRCVGRYCKAWQSYVCSKVCMTSKDKLFQHADTWGVLNMYQHIQQYPTFCCGWLDVWTNISWIAANHDVLQSDSDAFRLNICAVNQWRILNYGILSSIWLVVWDGIKTATSRVLAAFFARIYLVTPIWTLVFKTKSYRSWGWRGSERFSSCL